MSRLRSSKTHFLHTIEYLDIIYMSCEIIIKEKCSLTGLGGLFEINTSDDVYDSLFMHCMTKISSKDMTFQFYINKNDDTRGIIYEIINIKACRVFIKMCLEHADIDNIHQDTLEYMVKNVFMGGSVDTKTVLESMAELKM